MSREADDLSQFSLLDLFRMEAEGQVRHLTEGLLRLESGGAGAEVLDGLMRAAHSIKGAAAIVGLQVVVWGPAARDWEEGTPDEVAARAMVGLRPGSVVLLHDGLWLPPGQAPPTFDRTESIRVLLASMGDAGLAGSSLGRLLASGRPRPTAWFRP